MKEKKDAYVFISHSSKDNEEALQLHSILTNRYGITCWMDVFDIEIDEEVFQRHIMHALNNASAVVVIQNKLASKAPYVEREIAEAKEKNIPVFHYLFEKQIQAEQKVEDTTGADKSQKRKLTWFQKLRIALLAFRIRIWVTLPYWLSVLTMLAITFALAASIFVITRSTVYLVVNTIQRNLPDAIRSQYEGENDLQIVDPKAVAPFHIIPQYALLIDDFPSDAPLNQDIYPYEIPPSEEYVEIYQQNGSLHFTYSSSCLIGRQTDECNTEINSAEFNLQDIHYYGIRVRSLQNSPYQEISFSISTTGSKRLRSGFGWVFSDHVTSFFRPNEYLPEKDYYAYIPFDDKWHAYEIVYDPDTAILTYYMDGQLLDTYTIEHPDAWNDAPLMFISYAIVGGGGESIEEYRDRPITDLEIDQLIIGGFQPENQ